MLDAGCWMLDTGNGQLETCNGNSEADNLSSIVRPFCLYNIYVRYDYHAAVSLFVMQHRYLL
jgi:hypothetical protein